MDIRIDLTIKDPDPFSFRRLDPDLEKSRRVQKIFATGEEVLRNLCAHGERSEISVYVKKITKKTMTVLRVHLS